MALYGDVVALMIFGIAFASPSNLRAETDFTAHTPPHSDTRRASPNSRRLLAFAAVASAMSPTSGPIEGNTLVTLTIPAQADWNTYTGVIECAFGTTRTKATAVSDTSITCRSPRQAPGSAAVTVFIGATAADTLQTLSLIHI
eukprot:TRINITY_DN676_c0_g1_i1.p2 TRINITY_DN676_c0_g1~~TRINITY_DN676_c0_g1_i1.p2  ORF type:complete len:143 (-),score=28.78 TRINITY_DN676_c0_g1_i1:163-591(-)